MEALEKGVNQVIDLISSDNNVTIISIAGGSGSGKSLFAKMLSQTIGSEENCIISIDNYYKGRVFLNAEQKKGNTFSFDDIESIDIELLISDLKKLKEDQSIEKPVYSMKSESREGYETVIPKKIIILEGIYALHEKLIPHADIRVFIDSDFETRGERRVARDTKRTSQTLQQMKEMMAIAEEKYQSEIVTTQKNATIVIQN